MMMMMMMMMMMHLNIFQQNLHRLVKIILHKTYTVLGDKDKGSHLPTSIKQK